MMPLYSRTTPHGEVRASIQLEIDSNGQKKVLVKRVTKVRIKK